MHFLEDFCQEKGFFLGQNSVSWARSALFHGILHIILNQICKNDAFAAKISNTRQTKIFMAIFALAERLPTSAE